MGNTSRCNCCFPGCGFDAESNLQPWWGTTSMAFLGTMAVVVAKLSWLIFHWRKARNGHRVGREGTYQPWDYQQRSHGQDVGRFWYWEELDAGRWQKFEFWRILYWSRSKGWNVSGNERITLVNSGSAAEMGSSQTLASCATWFWLCASLCSSSVTYIWL